MFLYFMRLHPNLEEYIRNQKEKLGELSGFPESGIIQGCYLSSSIQSVEYCINSHVASFEVDSRGILMDRHRRVSRESTGRERPIYGKIGGKKPIIKEKRHIFAISPEDLSLCSTIMGVPITAELIGANMLIEAIDKRSYSLSKLPRGTYIIIGDEGDLSCPSAPIAVFEVYGQQLPCAVTGAAIANYYHNQTLAKKFVEEAKNNRGVVLTVEYPVAQEDAPEGVIISPARIKQGQKVFFKFPTGKID